MLIIFITYGYKKSYVLLAGIIINSKWLVIIEHKIHGILIGKDGKLVFEEYFPGYAFYHGALTRLGRKTNHDLASVTRSFTSALIGLAIDKGFIQDVSQKVFPFFPEYRELKNEEKEK